MFNTRIWIGSKEYLFVRRLYSILPSVSDARHNVNKERTGRNSHLRKLWTLISVKSPEQYVEKAIEIANLPKNKLLEIKSRFKEAAFKKLFENSNYINELENFLISLFKK